MTSGAFSLGSAITGLSTTATGRLTDKFGPRMVMTFCGLFLGLGFILMSKISSVLHLYLFYGLLVGTGMSGSFIPLTSTIARWFFKKRGLMTGLVAAGSWNWRGKKMNALCLINPVAFSFYVMSSMDITIGILR